jgi:hypothetical protein
MSATGLAASTRSVPCTRETQRCADATRYDAVLPDCCRGHLRRMVADIMRVLDSRNIVWWADYGTLLGAVRNPLTTAADYPWLTLPAAPIPPGIIPHDKDADFGILGVGFDVLKNLQQLLQREGYDAQLRQLGPSLKVRLSSSNKTNVDLFVWRERSDGMLLRNHYIAVDAFKGREFPKTELFPLSTVEWEGLALPAPRDPAAFCEFRYGSTWRTPVAANHDGRRRP